MGHASDLFAARATPGDISENSVKVIVEKLQEISLKIEKTSPSNNIVINPCHSTQSQPKQHSSTQTEHSATQGLHGDGQQPDGGARPDLQVDDEAHGGDGQNDLPATQDDHCGDQQPDGGAGPGPQQDGEVQGGDGQHNPSTAQHSLWLQLLTFNIEGFYRNFQYLRQIISIFSTKLIFLQEGVGPSEWRKHNEQQIPRIFRPDFYTWPVHPCGG